MRILVVGSGAREHALIWKLGQSPRKPELFAAPGNAGIAELATCLTIEAEDVSGVVAAAQSNAIDLVLVGPEAPLAAGMVDACQKKNIRVFGRRKLRLRSNGLKRFQNELWRRPEFLLPRLRFFQTMKRPLSMYGITERPS